MRKWEHKDIKSAQWHRVSDMLKAIGPSSKIHTLKDNLSF